MGRIEHLFCFDEMVQNNLIAPKVSGPTAVSLLCAGNMHPERMFTSFTELEADVFGVFEIKSDSLHSDGSYGMQQSSGLNRWMYVRVHLRFERRGKS